MTQKTVDNIVEEALEYVKEGEFNQALRLFSLCDETSTNPLFYVGKATALFYIHAKAGELDLKIIKEIVTLYEQALTLNPEQLEPYLMLGLTYQRKAEIEMRKGRHYSDIIASLHSAEDNMGKALKKEPTLGLTFKAELESVAAKKELYRQRLH